MKKPQSITSDAIIARINSLYKIKDGFNILLQLLAEQRTLPLGDVLQYWVNEDAGNDKHTREFYAALGQTPALRYNLFATFKNQLPHSNDYRNLNGSTPAVVCNERDVKTTLKKLSILKPADAAEGAARVGVMVADAHVLSMLPELSRHVDVMILADFDTLVTKNILFQLLCLRKAKNHMEFMVQYINPAANPVILANISTKNMSSYNADTGARVKIPSKTIDMEVVRSMLDSNANKLQEFSPYIVDQSNKKAVQKSEKRFLECKAAAEKIKFVAAPCNFFNPEDINNLRTCLFDQSNKRLGEITYLNLSNLQHYDANQHLTHCMRNKTRSKYNGTLTTNLRNLTEGQKAEPIILYSTSTLANNNFETLFSQVTIGLERYQVAVLKDICAILEAWDKAHPKASGRGFFPTIENMMESTAPKQSNETSNDPAKSLSKK